MFAISFDMTILDLKPQCKASLIRFGFKIK